MIESKTLRIQKVVGMIRQSLFMRQKSVGMIQRVYVDDTEQDVYDTKSYGDDTA